jgi:hypothetical protein
MRTLARLVLSWDDEGPMEDFVLLVQAVKADVGPCEESMPGEDDCSNVLVISDPDGGDPDNPTAYCLAHLHDAIPGFVLETHEEHFPSSNGRKF